jgi:multidrug efflux pump subunit AcrA (membrane-fusion protein)
MNVKKIKAVSVAVFVSAVTIGSTACKLGEPVKTQASPPPPAVVLADVEQRTVPIFSEFVGQTKAFETVEVRARVEGVLDKIYYTEGAVVNKGELLVTIDKREYQANLHACGLSQLRGLLPSSSSMRP